MAKSKKVLLTFDLEEFDLIKGDGQYSISYKGAKILDSLLDAHGVRATFFTTAKFAQHYPKLIKSLSKKDHEIALHGYAHHHDYSKMPKEDSLNYLKKGKFEIEKLTKKKIMGFRAPRILPPAYEILKKIGIKYDSSLHPTYVPGRYNRFLSKRLPFVEGGIRIIPISVTKNLRAPISWLWFRNLGLPYIKSCIKFGLIDMNYLNIYFHPWEFTNLEEHKLPLLIKRQTGEKFVILMEDFIQWCSKKKMQFSTIENWIKNDI